MDIYLIINIAIILFFIIMFIRGVKTGFLMQLANIAGVILALLISNYIAPVIAEYIQIWPKEFGIIEYDIINKVFYNNLNQIAWFLIIFVIVNILFFIIRRAIKFIEKLPVLKEVSKILGGLLGIVVADLWILMIIFVLNLPVIKDGKNYINHTWLLKVQEANTLVMGEYINPFLETQKFSDLVDNIAKLNDSDKTWLREFLEDQNIEDFYINDILNNK